MTRHVVVTTCNAEQWERYGRTMAATFNEHWTSSVPLWLFAEGFDPFGDVPIERVVDLETASPWLAGFKRAYADGRSRGRANGGSYDFRRDAVRFSHKIAAITAAAADTDCEVLIWIDADTVTHAPVTEAWLEELFPAKAGLAWLDRVGIYPECGFMMFRLPAALGVIRELGRVYASGDVFQMDQTHDSYVIWDVVKRAVKRGEIEVASLSGAGRHCVGHPWVNSRLGECMDHLKGARKDLGKTPPRDLERRRPEPYWQ